MFVASSCSRLLLGENGQFAKPFCQCWSKMEPLPWKQTTCACGEDHQVNEWSWAVECATSEIANLSWVVLSGNKKQITFHPCYSSGTAAARGDTPLLLNHQYYWEIKILTQTYGTDIMVGVGTQKVNLLNDRYQFASLLGQDEESYGLSYRGALRHKGQVVKECEGFCRGSIVGVRLDMWNGTLEFYINRKPQGIFFYNLRQHEFLFPMVSSTAAQSSMRLTYAASWKASLLVDAVKILASSLRDKSSLPPGLLYIYKSHFWMTLPSGADTTVETEEGKEREALAVASNVPSEVISRPYDNGFHVDNDERNYRLVVWQ